MESGPDTFDTFHYFSVSSNDTSLPLFLLSENISMPPEENEITLIVSWLTLRSRHLRSTPGRGIRQAVPTPT